VRWAEEGKKNGKFFFFLKKKEKENNEQNKRKARMRWTKRRGRERKACHPLYF
jgi:ribosomal protein L24E